MPIRPWRCTEKRYSNADHKDHLDDRLWRALDRVLKARHECDLSMGNKGKSTGTAEDLLLAQEKERRYKFNLR